MLFAETIVAFWKQTANEMSINVTVYKWLLSQGCVACFPAATILKSIGSMFHSQIIFSASEWTTRPLFSPAVGVANRFQKTTTGTKPKLPCNLSHDN